MMSNGDGDAPCLGCQIAAAVPAATTLLWDMSLSVPHAHVHPTAAMWGPPPNRVVYAPIDLAGLAGRFREELAL